MNGLSMFPPRASLNAGEFDALYVFLVVVSTVMTVLIFFFVAFFAIKYRRQSPDDRPKAIHGSIPLEVAWSVLPFLVMLIMFAWGTKLYFQSYAAAPANSLDVYVLGKQWMWKIQYPGGQREINELHVPVGRPVQLTLASEDVIHSFYVPAFRLKHDAVPGSYQTFWFEATTPGRYRIYCAEYCGTNHSEMKGWVTVMEPSAYEEWLSGGNRSVLEQGQDLFARYGCVTCHVESQQGRCPSLRNVYGRPVLLEDGRTVTADDAYLRESILHPNTKIVKGYKQDVMPVFEGQINEEELLKLLIYVKSLSTPTGVPAPGTAGSQTAPAQRRTP